ncbi:hypothetical protein C3747_164g70 [Trypanosoma cruzi]|uniref:Uncharacterized protein n=2 Tax=Trypanosoma cruzi TaxID=5693 RepID=Q4DMG5_TRYCC|nr:hypothetical protein, conserved [Trypanosoma cruzi]EAN93714.1 hypothetical protein, conserved [Trypanosoma cruzi]PWV04009.1 hypothetical protein C3747_164g70 [Trypanosoma cruzi]|eukprot:XP_815565.1 hypothetical protein [Trypanosoma cruzi strain CL Brener]
MRRVHSQLSISSLAGGPLSSASCRCPPIAACCGTQARHCMGPSREKQRSRPNADPGTGNQMSLIEPPDLTQHIQFGMNNLEHVMVPEVPEERRNRTDVEKEHEMRSRFGEYGPGERLTKSSQQMRRDMLQEQQDVDGLPWEVRWRKGLIPTAEEMIQEVRDRFDLYIQDPIEREQEWYLHWKDRSFKIQKDRMIWPQGYTDYLDHYDEHGRRRVLPSDQRWSDTSWKHLADTKYKDRMWLIEGEERKAVHESLREDRTLMEEEEQRQLEMGNVYNGIVSGVVDLDPEQTYQALSGTADPLEVARTKMKIQAYGAKQALQDGRKPGTLEVDPISGFPKADMEPLPTGITVEQGASIAAEANIRNEMLEQTADMARQAGHDAVPVLMKTHHNTSKQHGDRPVLRSLVEKKIEETKRLQKTHGACKLETMENVLHNIESKIVPTLDAQDKGALPEEDLLAASKANSTSQYGVLESETKKEVPSGFIHVTKRPQDAEPNIPVELYNTPKEYETETIPEWYRETLVETEPLIQAYDLTHDPLETREAVKVEYYQPPKLIEETRITNDEAIGGISAFDEMKMHKLQSLPELVEGYKPLPLFRELRKGDQKEGETGLTKGATEKKKSEKLRKERQERLKKAKVQYDPDILLPSLPWETDSITDPYRGVAAEDAVDFNKPDMEKTWRAYRDTFRQSITEFGNLTQVTTEEKCEQMLMDTMDRFRRGDVGEHPTIPEEHEAIFRMIFEAHTKHFLADFYKFKGNRVTEAKTTKAEADEILRRASAKCKLLGPSFMNFIQEMTSLELDSVRKNPAQRYVIMIRDRKYESLGKPFMNWITNELGEFILTEFKSVEQLETNLEFLRKHVNDAKFKCPMRVEGVTNSARDAAVEAFFQWCRGALCFYAGKQLHQMYIEFADTRFRTRAEDLFEDSIECFSNYAKAANGVVQIPIPDSDPPYEYDEKEFLDGEHAVYAEISGQLDKAEGLWHSGTSKRWYPVTDETEYMWYNERRGRLTLAMDISDRCLENVNKKTHPSIHPFPERARPFLEGAPLTQETAEHLWMRHMGDLYNEHSEFMFRQGRFQTGRSYREKCLNFYHLAIRTARERLPSSWKAPLLTEAKYLMRVYEPGCDVERHLREVEVVVDKLFAAKEPRHWLEPFSDLPYRIALVHANLAAFGECITNRVNARLKNRPSNELLLRGMEKRAHGGAYLPELEEYFSVANEVAEEVFRKKVLRWRSQEHEGSDPYLFWTHLYFAFRVQPKNADEVRKMWDMYEPAYLYIYTQGALASRNRGQKLINDALRRMCQILLSGDESEKKILLRELTNVREKLAHLIDRRELDRTIYALQAHLADPTHSTFTYGSSLLYRDAVRHERIANNPNLRSDIAAKEYAELQKRRESLRAHETTLSPQQAAKLQERQSSASSMNEEALGSQPDLSTREIFEAEGR